MSRGDVSTNGWVQPLAVLLIDEACQRLPEPERMDRGREWIAEVHAILDDQDFGRWRRALRALRFAVGQYRTVGRAVAKSTAAGRPGTSKYGGDLGAVLLVPVVAASVFGGGIGYVTGTHSLVADVAVLLGTTVVSLALVVATVVVAVRRSSRRVGPGSM